MKKFVAPSRTLKGSPKGRCSHDVTSLPIKLFYAEKTREWSVPLKKKSSTTFHLHQKEEWDFKFGHRLPKKIHPYKRQMVKNEINRDATHLAANEEEFGIPPVFVESQRRMETSSSGKEVVYHPSVLADEQATAEE
ncbi:hypothetical protein C1H46_002916 [Malus baccata]|uniref:Uncharacterized protein n=1 Tax=Malus baccata TaxID=106549 RepID=A0A540NKJ4_MALBA|nr:hypothetical protein C1H46_002916 [Malus baccata]